ncbi:MarR family winged helix-turn-helix transcriptional regulator, partial [Christiangramia marina]|uniref:MarR family winged helix-turn-helix transcriptional regulator n=1 Tax=Christiangramia marina TaxID=409436 RepID=UPI003AA82417
LLAQPLHQARHLRLVAPGMLRQVALGRARPLREKGLIDARPDEADRRSTRLYLTATGEATYADMQRHGELLAAQALSGLSDDERRQLGGLLARVQANLLRE